MIGKIDGGVTSPIGFAAAAAEANIKYSGRTDMALIYSEKQCAAAGVYTTNVVKAAPVIWDRDITQNRKTAQAVVVNSGIANACTGSEGMDICEQTARHTADALSCLPEDVLVASTGVIGMQIPVDKIKNGVDQMSKGLSGDREAGRKAACAIMTTDTTKKESAVAFEIGGHRVTIGAMAKGSGMIHPDMCTMLAFVTTDACISQAALAKALSCDVQDSFNMISVDGDTSTNDTVLLLANGCADNPQIEENTTEYELFCRALKTVTTDLAKQIAGDGEGATALIEVTVSHAATKEDAKKLAKSVVCSNLTKCAVAGHDANWGRILCALGYAKVDFDPQLADIEFESANGKVCVVKSGKAAVYSEEEATHILSAETVKIKVDLHGGEACATAWGCDLTHGYIDINADYRS